MSIAEATRLIETHTQDTIKLELLPRRLCLLYTSDAADDMQCVDLGGRRIIKKICADHDSGLAHWGTAAGTAVSALFKQKTAYEM